MLGSLEFVGAGTALNVLAILVGASLGIAAGSRLSTKSQSLITDILGLITLLGAASALAPLWSKDFNDALPDSSSLLVILAAMLIGGLIGSLLSLESRLDSFGEICERDLRHPPRALSSRVLSQHPCSL